MCSTYARAHVSVCLHTYRACLRRCRRQRDSLDLHLAILICEECAGDIINLHVSHLNFFTAPPSHAQTHTHTAVRLFPFHHTNTTRASLTSDNDRAGSVCTVAPTNLRRLANDTDRLMTRASKHQGKTAPFACKSPLGIDLLKIQQECERGLTQNPARERERGLTQNPATL